MDISILKTTAIFITFMVSTIMPIAIMLYYRKKSKMDFFSIISAVVLYIVFGIALKTLISIPLDSFLAQGIVKSILIACVSSAILEETGRFIGFKIIKSYEKDRGINTGILYGISQGATQDILSIGLNYFIMFILAIISYFKSDISGGLAPYLLKRVNILNELSGKEAIMVGLLSVYILFVNICLSVIMRNSVMNKRQLYLYPICVLIHIVLSLPILFYSVGMISSMIIVAIIMCVLLALLIYYSYTVFETGQNRRIFGKY